MDRFTQYAIAGNYLSFRRWKYRFEKLDKERIGVVIGSGIGGMETLETEHSKLLRKGPRRVSPLIYSYDDIKYGTRTDFHEYGLKGS